MEAVRNPLDVESQIATLDQKEMEIHQTQLRLVRKQVTILTGDLLVLQRDVTQLKAFMSHCDSLQKSQASAVGSKIREVKEALDYEREDRNVGQNDLHNRIVGLEQVLVRPDDVASLRAEMERLHDRVGGARYATEDYVAKERMDRINQQDSFREKLEALQRSVTSLDEQLRKEVEERRKENRVIWDGLDSHTHDLDSKVMEELAAGLQRPRHVELPPRSAASRAASPAPAAYAWRLTEQLLQPEGPTVARAPPPSMLPPTVRQVAASSPSPLRATVVASGAPLSTVASTVALSSAAAPQAQALSTAATTVAFPAPMAVPAGPPSLSTSTSSLLSRLTPRG